ncbi:MAG: phosphotransferase, partial [Lysobacter sp.]|nr:phosphotransferase [Lysobacter sp.]
MLGGEFCAEHSTAEEVAQGRAMANDQDDGETDGASAYDASSRIAASSDAGGLSNGRQRFAQVAPIDSQARARHPFADSDYGIRRHISTAGISIRRRTMAQPRTCTDMPVQRSDDPLLSESSAAAVAVTDWLRSQGVDVGGRPDIRRCDGGMSHLTYRLRYDSHDLVLRRPLPGQGGLQRIRREFALQAALRPHYPVADMVRLCVDQGIVGTPFYVMRYVPGLVPRRRSFAGVA